SFLMIRPPPTSTLLPYTTLFRSIPSQAAHNGSFDLKRINCTLDFVKYLPRRIHQHGVRKGTLPIFVHDINQLINILSGKDVIGRSEEHTSELQSRENLVCRLLLE